ncbi:MAG: GNAT family N-acetyltransferase [Bacteroidales bacterium]|jgi:ribosomal protein S18 acetylase RimI-like enzyme|nr:GNAT family N-acetyltransferase [Bacteroidales bacterium]
MAASYSIRPLDPSERHLLRTFLYEAIFMPEGDPRPDYAVIFLPELTCYYEDFGKPGDDCLVAEIDGEVVAAVWIRVFETSRPGYGYVDAETPEISMSVLPDYRRQGIGKALFYAMLERMTRTGWERVSLSVDLVNYARKLYEGAGFKPVKIVGESVTMVKALKP